MALPPYMDPARYRAAGGMTNEEYERAIAANPTPALVPTAIGSLPTSAGAMVNPAGLNGGGVTQPQMPSGGAGGFPAWMQQQLQASMAPVAPLTTPRLGGGQMPMPGIGGLFGGAPQAGGPVMGAALGGGLLGGAPQPNPGVSAGGLPTQGAATGFPGLGMPSTSGGGYEAMKAGTLGQIADMRRAAVDARRAQAPTLQQFASTFNSLPNDADKFVYWNSQPEKGMYDPFVNSLPGFRDWVNQMFNNYAGGSLAGAKWNPLTNSIRQ